MAYINTDDFLELFAVASVGQDKQFINTVKEVIADTPVANVVEVVRCCDCVYKRENQDINNTSYLSCNKNWGLRGVVDPTDFCSYGERND